jgi:hypothetical protein
MPTVSSHTERHAAAHGAASGVDRHLAVALALSGAAFWILGCAVLAATGHHVLSFLGSALLLGAVTGLVVYATPPGAARRPMQPTDWSSYDRRHSRTTRRRARALGRAIPLGRSALRRAQRLVHRRGAGLPYPVSRPPSAHDPGARASARRKER